MKRDAFTRDEIDIVTEQMGGIAAFKQSPLHGRLFRSASQSQTYDLASDKEVAGLKQAEEIGRLVELALKEKRWPADARPILRVDNMDGCHARIMSWGDYEIRLRLVR